MKEKYEALKSLLLKAKSSRQLPKDRTISLLFPETAGHQGRILLPRMARAEDFIPMIRQAAAAACLF